MMFFRKKEKVVTETYSQYRIPGKYFITQNCRIKIIIDPPVNYFTKKIESDKKNYDKLILIHGCETPDLNNIESKVLEYGDVFTKIHSFSENVISKFNHAELFYFGSSWVLTNKNQEIIALKKDYSQYFKIKTNFKVSFIRSNKKQLPGHKVRYQIENILRKKYGFDFYFPEVKIETKIPLFEDSMYHITIENSRHKNYITEKVIDCFMSYTIPIYWGCPNIGDYFDMNGIITFETEQELEQILNNLTPQFYNDRIESIKKNYEIAKEKFAFFFDNINDKLKNG